MTFTAPGSAGPHFVAGRVTCDVFSEELRQQQLMVSVLQGQPAHRQWDSKRRLI